MTQNSKKKFRFIDKINTRITSLIDKSEPKVTSLIDKKSIKTKKSKQKPERTAYVATPD